MDASPFSRVLRVPRTGSTNDDLREAALADPDRWPHGSALVTDHQAGGKGRAGRGWQTPPGAAMTASVLLRPGLPGERLGWLPLLTGLAVHRALSRVAKAAGASQQGTPGDGGAGRAPVAAQARRVAAVRFGVKWPNDVLALDVGEEDLEGYGRDRKLVGILGEVLPVVDRAPAAVVGIGVNVRQDPGELPTPAATSLRVLGVETTPDEVLTAVGQELLALVERWARSEGDVAASGLHAEISRACVTLGTRVRVELPGRSALTGTAVALDGDGRLLVRPAGAPQADPVPIAAGDVRHLRRADAGAPHPPISDTV